MIRSVCLPHQLVWASQGKGPYFMYLLFLPTRAQWLWSPCEGWRPWVLCLSCPQSLASCLAHQRCLINISWTGKIKKNFSHSRLRQNHNWIPDLFSLLVLSRALQQLSETQPSSRLLFLRISSSTFPKSIFFHVLKHKPSLAGWKELRIFLHWSLL